MTLTGTPSPHSSPTSRTRLKIGQIGVDHITFTETRALICAWAKERRCRYIVTPNADHVVVAEHDLDFRLAYTNADLSVCDGTPVLWASWLLAHPLPHRICGSDLMPALCADAAKSGLSIFIFGGPPGAAEQAAVNLQADHPGLKIAGTSCPPMGFETRPQTDAAAVHAIDLVSPDIVFVGLGSPKQEIWLQRHRGKINAGVLIGIGASIEFTAKTKKRAPVWMLELGIEWLFRFFQEPKRLGKRYLGDVRMVGIILRQIAGRMRPR